MRKVAAALLAVAIATTCVTPVAEGAPHPHSLQAAYRIDSDTLTAPAMANAQTPDLGVIAAFAGTFWPHSPCAGRATASYGSLPASNENGEAFLDGSCHIIVRPGLSAIVTCAVVTHEFGHLALGPTHFSATNPVDPDHSLDPHNIMYAAQEAYPPCDRRFGTPSQWLAIAKPQLEIEEATACRWLGYRRAGAAFACRTRDGTRLRLIVTGWHDVAIEVHS